MKCVFRAWRQLKRGLEVVAVREMCIEGMGAIGKRVLRCRHWVKCVLRAWGQLKRRFEVMALG